MKVKKIILIWILLMTMTSFVVPSIFVILFGYCSMAQRIYQISTVNQFIILLFGFVLIKKKSKRDCVNSIDTYIL